MKLPITIFCSALYLCITAVAAPASWFKWRSKLDGQEICVQTPPGAGWEQVSGPYKDPHCMMPGSAGR